MLVKTFGYTLNVTVVGEVTHTVGSSIVEKTFALHFWTLDAAKDALGALPAPFRYSGQIIGYPTITKRGKLIAEWPAQWVMVA